MQSFLQYRRFRAAVEAQLDRDQDRAQYAGRDVHHSQHSAPGSTSVKEKHNLEREPLPDSAHDINSVPTSRVSQPGGVGRPTDIDLEQQLPRNSNTEQVEEEEEDGKKAEEDSSHHDVESDDDRRMDHTLSKTTTQQSAGIALGTVLTGVHVRRRATKEGGEGHVFVVGFEGPNDPSNPHNWPLWRRAYCTMLIASIGCVVGLASSIDSSALPQAAAEFGVAEVVESMATGLFLVGFGCGALFAGPFSETVGRNPVYIVTLALYMVFIMASALAPNIGAQLAFRFLAGFFGSTPLTCAGGSLSDLWNPLERVLAFPIFANAAFTGPVLGPVIGGYVAQYLDWRWVEWITLIISGLVFTLVVLFQPETYPQTLLKWKAEHIRTITGDDRYRAEIEVRRETFVKRLQRALYRPFLMTMREPIIFLLALYLTVIYIVLFTFLDGYTYVFQETYGISQGLTGLCFLGIVLGLFIASVPAPFLYRWAKRDLAEIQKQGGEKLPPEIRLWYAMLGGSFAIPISLFWMAWTAYPHISIWSPLVASVFFGYGILCVFISSYQYIIDTYESFAASALASVTLIRYASAGGMVVVGIPFYENLGVHYTLTILACISVLLAPLPFVFYKYGHWVRSKSRYAATADSTTLAK